MFKRVMVAVVGIPALILVLGVAPDWAALALTMVLCGVGAQELLHAVLGGGGKTLLRLTVLVAAVLPFFVFEEAGGLITERAGLPVVGALGLTFVVLMFLCAILEYRSEEHVLFRDVTAAIFAGLVFPLMLSCLLRLRMGDFGQLLVFVPLGISFGSDTFALFAGLLCGRHKLTPVSPKKTVEGCVGGLLGGVIGLALVKGVGLWALGLPFLTWGQVVLIGLAGSVVSQLGDLSFSIIKREFGVKDYGKLLPGHGGVLDRFDSVTFVTPFVWLVLQFL